jgi:hypothetical protein
MIRHYDARSGISGYKVGDILIETTSGETSRVVTDARGAALEPTIADVPFTEAVGVAQIGMRLAPIDVGFDLRAEGMAITTGASAATMRVSYATRRGERRVVSGPRADVLMHLRRQGYRFQEVR